MHSILIPPNTTLLRVVINRRQRFLNQDWYFDEEFANIDVGGTWSLNYHIAVPAAVWAYAYLHGILSAPLDRKFVWTSDLDSSGDRVYVGRAYERGFQIHRHLTIKPEMFLNGELT